jgi:NitT/TauT family transport system substrate-binding protein
MSVKRTAQPLATRSARKATYVGGRVGPALGVASGEYDVVLAVGAEKMREVPSRGSLVAQAVERGHPVLCKGRTAPGMFALLATRYFKEYGIEPELVFFQAAAPIATALAAGQIDVGATGITAALFNIVLGGEKLWIVADKGREWPGYPLTAIVVQKALWEAGLRTPADLKGKRVGVTQLGSTFHYHLGNILEKEGLSLADLKVVPLQAMPAVMDARKFASPTGP